MKPGVWEGERRAITVTLRKQQQKSGVRGENPRTAAWLSPTATNQVIHTGTYSDEPVPLGPLEDNRSLFRLCRAGSVLWSRVRVSGTERKLWLASFHQDARTDAAILLRSAPATVQSVLDPGCSLILPNPETKARSQSKTFIILKDTSQPK